MRDPGGVNSSVRLCYKWGMERWVACSFTIVLSPLHPTGACEIWFERMCQRAARFTAVRQVQEYVTRSHGFSLVVLLS